MIIEMLKDWMINSYVENKIEIVSTAIILWF